MTSGGKRADLLLPCGVAARPSSSPVSLSTATGSPRVERSLELLRSECWEAEERCELVERALPVRCSLPELKWASRSCEMEDVLRMVLIFRTVALCVCVCVGQSGGSSKSKGRKSLVLSEEGAGTQQTTDCGAHRNLVSCHWISAGWVQVLCGQLSLQHGMPLRLDLLL